MSENAEPLKIGLLLGGGRIFQAMVALVGIRLLTTYFPDTQVGLYYLLTAHLAFINLVIFNPLGMFFSRHVVHWSKKNEFTGFLSFFCILFFGFSALSGIVSFLLLPYIYNDIDLNMYLFLTLFTVGIFVSVLYRNSLSSLNILLDRYSYVKYLFAAQLGTLCLWIAIIFLGFFPKESVYWLFVVSLSETLILVPIFRYLQRYGEFNLRKIKTKINFSNIRLGMNFCYPIAITTLAMWLHGYAYRFFVEEKFSLTVLAGIAVGLSVASAIFSIAESLIQQYFNPIFLNKIYSASRDQRIIIWRKIAAPITLMYFCVGAFVVIMAPQLLIILVGEKYHNVGAYVQVGVFIELARVHVNLLNWLAQSEYRNELLISPYVAGFIVVVLLFWKIPVSVGGIGVTMALAISYFIVLLFALVKIHAMAKFKIRTDIIGLALALIPLCLVELLYPFDSILGGFFKLAICGAICLSCILIILRNYGIFKTTSGFFHIKS